LGRGFDLTRAHPCSIVPRDCPLQMEGTAGCVRGGKSRFRACGEAAGWLGRRLRRNRSIVAGGGAEARRLPPWFPRGTPRSVCLGVFCFRTPGARPSRTNDDPDTHLPAVRVVPGRRARAVPGGGGGARSPAGRAPGSARRSGFCDQRPAARERARPAGGWAPRFHDGESLRHGGDRDRGRGIADRDADHHLPGGDLQQRKPEAAGDVRQRPGG